jgi:hypothetical protein
MGREIVLGFCAPMSRLSWMMTPRRRWYGRGASGSARNREIADEGGSRTAPTKHCGHSHCTRDRGPSIRRLDSDGGSAIPIWMTRVRKAHSQNIADCGYLLCAECSEEITVLFRPRKAVEPPVGLLIPRTTGQSPGRFFARLRAGWPIPIRREFWPVPNRA